MTKALTKEKILGEGLFFALTTVHALTVVRIARCVVCARDGCGTCRAGPFPIRFVVSNETGFAGSQNQSHFKAWLYEPNIDVSASGVRDQNLST
jgi:hypothetical protein